MVNHDPTVREVRQFAGLLCVFLATLTGILLTRTGSVPAAAACGTTALLVAVAGCLAPARIRPVFVGWMRLVRPVNALATFLLLTVVFFGVIAPIGLLLRLLRRDPLERDFDRAAPTYWRPHNPATGPAQYLRQF